MPDHDLKCMECDAPATHAFGIGGGWDYCCFGCMIRSILRDEDPMDPSHFVQLNSNGTFTVQEV